MLELDALTYHHTNEQGQGKEYIFSLKNPAGQITGITGQSGSGKSTLLDLVAGFLLPYRGSLTWNGSDLTKLPPEDRPVTILFQDNNLFEHLSAEKNIAIGINTSLRLTGEESERVHQALADVGLQGFGTRRAGKLSGGEQQRVALARALVRDKPVLLLDEPFSALDGETRQAMLALIRQIADKYARSVIMVTHDERDCAAIADNHYALSNGELHLQG